jgi:hypothetical protein
VEGKQETDEAEAGQAVSKAEYVLSVLLRLGKLDYDADVHVWAQVSAVCMWGAVLCRTRWCNICLTTTTMLYQKFDAMDVEGRGCVTIHTDSSARA